MAVAVLVTKKAQPDPGFRDAREREFLRDVQSDERAVLARAQAIARGERRTLPLTYSERQAFLGLVDTVDDGWDFSGEQIERAKRRAGPTLVTMEAVILDVVGADPPLDFLQTYERRELKLAGTYEQARLARVQKTISKGVSIGASLPEIEAQLAEDLPTFSNARLHNIARTETSILWSHGKYARSSVDPFVAGWEFLAVMDARTTDECASRNGRQWLKPDEPDVPPIHYMCRSELLDIYGTERADRVGLPADAPPPFKGFGKAPSGIPMVLPPPRLGPALVPTPRVADQRTLPPTQPIIPGAVTRPAFVSHTRRVLREASSILTLGQSVKELQRLARNTIELEAITTAAERRRRQLQEG